MRVILVHGIWSNGGASIDLLRPHLEAMGHEVVEYDYGPRSALSSWWYQDKDAQGLVDLYQCGDKIICHSNGCKLNAIAIEKGMPVEHVVFIRPALNVDWEPPVTHPVKRIDVYYSSQDRATQLARLSPFKMGAMGTYGPSSDSEVFRKHSEALRHSEGFVEHPGKYVETING